MAATLTIRKTSRLWPGRRAATEVGLAAFLAGDAGVQAVWESQRTATEVGLAGVPFYVIDGRYAVSGAQPAEVWLRTLEAIRTERIS